MNLGVESSRHDRMRPDQPEQLVRACPHTALSATYATPVGSLPLAPPLFRERADIAEVGHSLHRAQRSPHRGLVCVDIGDARDADARLARASLSRGHPPSARRSCAGVSPEDQMNEWTLQASGPYTAKEGYWYDALGQRVLLRRHQHGRKTGSPPTARNGPKTVMTRVTRRQQVAKLLAPIGGIAGAGCRRVTGVITRAGLSHNMNTPTDFLLITGRNPRTGGHCRHRSLVDFASRATPPPPGGLHEARISAPFT